MNYRTADGSADDLGCRMAVNVAELLACFSDLKVAVTKATYLAIIHDPILL